MAQSWPWGSQIAEQKKKKKMMTIEQNAQNRQVSRLRKACANTSSANINLSKTHLSTV